MCFYGKLGENLLNEPFHWGNMTVAIPFEGTWGYVSGDTKTSLIALLIEAHYAMQGFVTPPTNVCRKRPKTKNFNGSKWNVYYIISHVLTKKMRTHNKNLFCIGAEIWAFLCWYTWRNGTKAAGLAFENYYTLHFIQHTWYCYRLISYYIFVFFKAIKYIWDWADMNFKPKKWPNWSFFAEIMTGGRGRIKVKNIWSSLKFLTYLCVLLHNSIKLGKES